MSARRLYGAVAACAVVVYLGALWNQFALDDNQIVVYNTLVRELGGVWRAFASPYWPPQVSGRLYRPLPLVTYAIDWQVAGGAAWWFHAINVAWHAGASAAVAWLAGRWSGDRAALAAGLLFAVHPVHVEAVANVVGRAELMAALFAVLAVYAALANDRLGWSAVALAAGLLSKENAMVVPVPIAWGWMVGLARPSRRRMAAYAGVWLALGTLYMAVRWTVLGHEVLDRVAPVFFGASPVAVRLTAVAALTDVARLLVFPLTLRADYSPAERTLVPTPLDPRFAFGLLCLAAWGALLWRTWRGGRRVDCGGPVSGIEPRGACRRPARGAGVVPAIGGTRRGSRGVAQGPRGAPPRVPAGPPGRGRRRPHGAPRPGVARHAGDDHERAGGLPPLVRRARPHGVREPDRA